MTPDDLRIVIREGEGTRLEFKESLSSSFARELVPLTNTIGGKILLRVRDDGTSSAPSSTSVTNLPVTDARFIRREERAVDRGR